MSYELIVGATITDLVNQVNARIASGAYPEGPLFWNANGYPSQAVTDQAQEIESYAILLDIALSALEVQVAAAILDDMQPYGSVRVDEGVFYQVVADTGGTITNYRIAYGHGNYDFSASYAELVGQGYRPYGGPFRYRYNQDAGQVMIKGTPAGEGGGGGGAQPGDKIKGYSYDNGAMAASFDLIETEEPGFVFEARVSASDLDDHALIDSTLQPMLSINGNEGPNVDLLISDGRLTGIGYNNAGATLVTDQQQVTVGADVYTLTVEGGQITNIELQP